MSVKTGVERLRGACRFNRKPNPQRQSLIQRKRREGTGTCPAKFKLTVHPDGSRVLERFGDTKHTHDLEFIDSVKRNSAVRKIIVHEYFKSWDPGAILAYLRDPAHKADGRDLLKEAGGQHISRSEISNVMTAHLKKTHPGQDPFEIKCVYSVYHWVIRSSLTRFRRQQDKYKSFITCSAKGCTAPPFADLKDFKKHRQEAHGSVKRDHSHKMPCPMLGCARKKQSRGFISEIALQQHMHRYHGADAPDTTAAEEVPARDGMAAEPLEGADADENEVEGYDSDDAHVPPTASGGSLSAPARRNMEQRLAQKERERALLDEEIIELRLALYGPDSSANAEMQLVDGAQLAASIQYPGP